MLPQNLTPANTNTWINNNVIHVMCGGKTWKCEGFLNSAACAGDKATCSSGEPKEVDGGGGGGGSGGSGGSGGGGGGSSKKSGAVAVRGSLLWIVAAVQIVKKFLS